MKELTIEPNNNRKFIYSLVSTDGVPLFKSLASLWPISFVVLNLSTAICMNAENIILDGFWIGIKPVMKILFEPILSCGINIRTPANVHNVSFKLAMGIFDLAAKVAKLNAMENMGVWSVCISVIVCLTTHQNLSSTLLY